MSTTLWQTAEDKTRQVAARAEAARQALAHGEYDKARLIMEGAVIQARDFIAACETLRAGNTLAPSDRPPTAAGPR